VLGWAERDGYRREGQAGAFFNPASRGGLSVTGPVCVVNVIDVNSVIPEQLL
jgi:hypothetical protein